jgi:hypothetical protein
MAASLTIGEQYRKEALLGARRRDSRHFRLTIFDVRMKNVEHKKRRMENGKWRK